MKTPEEAAEPIEVVETLADALDRDDYEMARTVLDPEVTYQIGEEELNGADAVLESYEQSSRLAHDLFDKVDYEHEILGTEDGATFRVRYRDVLTADTEAHTHFSEQEVTLGTHWAVVKIVDQPVPGEREKLDQFIDRHGITRPLP